ncbi:MAG: prepilin-type N-terminal cleavage/methylation domain-containing protein [Nitrospirae bacterium]|nr:prepilin-type N-terminal cleavage/methylation domain-containing protein [Candidatus Manganitrophaceae bacterium]
MVEGKKSSHSSPLGQAGFTLLELMISLGIVAIIFVVIYGTFSNVHQGTQQMEADAERYRMTRMSLYYIANDLSMFFVSQDPEGNNAKKTMVFNGKNSERLQGNETFPNDAIEFSTVSHRRIGDVPASEQLVMRYALENRYLIQETRFSNGSILVNELAGPIEGLSFRYLPKNSAEWVETWETLGANPKAPTVVEIEFILKVEGHPPRRFKTWVDLPMGL